MKISWLVLSLSACGAPEPPAPVSPAPAAPQVAQEPASADQVALTRARTLVTEAAARLQARMVQDMKQHGPSEAVESCSIEAEALTTAGVRPPPDPATMPGERVGRSSLKLRNPENGAPPWVAEWLVSMGDRPYQDAKGIEQVVEVEGHRVAHFLKPIPVEPRCLVCHGGAETIPADVRAVLSQKYPEDHATGYAAGDLRGALWAEVPVGL